MEKKLTSFLLLQLEALLSVSSLYPFPYSTISLCQKYYVVATKSTQKEVGTLIALSVPQPNGIQDTQNIGTYLVLNEAHGTWVDPIVPEMVGRAYLCP
ncbi:hypothetical protein AA313_de0209885 [Arthrobotrys entomopaga]|nr:hypothetical protein AA313_de0209885 [Arthrobotrys entomopaga]